MPEDKRSVIEYGPSGSFRVGELPEGCKRCISGEKVVLYTTGSCSVGCAYCPIPEDRQFRDDVFINENRVKLDENMGFATIVQESESCLATGSGITGGDPMEVPERTISYIKKMREQFGKDYHLHLYTSGRFFINKEELIDQLFAAGLDELRFHPRNLKTRPVWDIAARAKQRFPHKWIGFEVPAISGRKEDLKDLIRFADEQGLDFVNLNEYEFTETNFNKLSIRGFVSLMDNSAIVGSKETAREVIDELKDKTSISLHFCSSGSKDSIQLVQRFKRRASQVKREFETISDEGEREYGRFALEDKEEFDEMLQVLAEYFDVTPDLMEIFEIELAVETAWYIVDEISKELREFFPELQAEIITRHPIENGPITFVDPR